MNIPTLPPCGYYAPAACDPEEFAALIDRNVDGAQIPHAEGAPRNVPVYDAARLDDLLAQEDGRRKLMAEWARILRDGAGVFVLRRAMPDPEAIDAASTVYERLIADERAADGTRADHFSAGTNDRVWNSLQKLCLAAPEIFVRYFASPAIDAACEAWLGPNYQMTAQINVVRPGGAAQRAHRDYHLGFQTAELSAAYPAHVHDLSPLMTLQGGIAHCDMDVQSGPTKLLPFSQLYRPGYAAWRREDFREIFEARYVQLPMERGDALFFNPALFHAAGENRSESTQRMVNLLQVSSAFGRAMEAVDRRAMCRAAFGPLRDAHAEGRLGAAAREAVLAATAEGYSFPTNLDRDPPVGGLAPRTQRAILSDAVVEGWDAERLDAELAALAARQLPT